LNFLDADRRPYNHAAQATPPNDATDIITPSDLAMKHTLGITGSAA
jgi:hypothetical protein